MPMPSPTPSIPAGRPARLGPQPRRTAASPGPGRDRIATTSQLRRMLRPDATRQLLSRVLNKLRSDGFIDRTVLPDASRSRTNAWYLTQEGARLTRGLPVLRGRLPYPITSTTAASLKTPHTPRGRGVHAELSGLTQSSSVAQIVVVDRRSATPTSVAKMAAHAKRSAGKPQPSACLNHLPRLVSAVS
ncbi:replication-relaxation family protein [Streptomyces sp. NPDC004533]|uniref:replication-relaxation family protein n=1 Tax=Streptomyces sp. NPDC004533 TaxID=3154278 RepID=UPI0033BC7BBA